MNSPPPIGSFLESSYHEPREFKHREDAVRFILGPHKELINKIDLEVGSKFGRILVIKEMRQALSCVSHHVEQEQRKKGRTLAHREVEEIIEKRMKEALKKLYGLQDLDFSPFEEK